MSFFREGNQIRPGLYVSTVNRSNGYSIFRSKEDESPVDEPTGEVLVSTDGVLYDNGLIFEAAIIGAGETVLVLNQNTGVAAEVIGGALVIQNPA